MTINQSGWRPEMGNGESGAAATHTGNRALMLEEGDGGPRLLHDRLRALAALAEWSVDVSAQKAKAGQPARAARVASVRGAATRVRVRAPAMRSGEHGREPHEVWAIRVWEPSPPEGAEPLEWLLLTLILVSVCLVPEKHQPPRFSLTAKNV